MPDSEFTQWLTGLDQFHFLRPWWLLAIPALLAVLWWLKRRQQAQGTWAKVIDPRWLPFLLDQEPGQRQRHNRWWILAGVLASLGLAGPSWQELPQPVHKEQGALVILLDLSPSMSAEDIKPNRITRARHKLRDILKSRKEGVTALVAYSGWPHVVSPLTDDTGTIISQVPVLEPGVMSSPGSNIEEALTMALKLLTDGGHNGGDLLIITDGIAHDALNTVRRSLRGKSVRLSILGVGTSDGAPIPRARGGFEKDANGGIVVAKLDRESLIDLAHSNGGHYSDLTADSRDLGYIQAAFGSPLEQRAKELNRTFDSWSDQGYWFALLLLPLVVATFRRGIIVALLLAPLIIPEPAHAADTSNDWSWKNLWLTPDQQGSKAFKAENFSEAQQAFKNKNWKGSAAYRQGDYEEALKAYSNDESASGYYNRGNALAHLGKIDEAIAAYDTVLEKDPNHEDAAANKKLLEDLKKQQQNQQNDQNSDDKSSDDKNSDQKNQDSQSQDQKSKDQQSEDSKDQQQDQSRSDSEQSDEQQRQQDQSQSGKDEKEEKSSSQQQKEDEQQQSQQQQPGDQESEEAEKQRQAAAQASEEEKDEAKRAMEQWLKKVPEDPGLFLRKKFRYQAEQRKMENHGQRKEKKRW